MSPSKRNDDGPGVSMDFLKPYAAQLLSVLRIMSGLLVLQHGTAKYLNFPVGPMNNASYQTMSGAAGLFELVCGALLVIGLLTRPAAFLLSGMTAVAYFWAHAPRGFFPILNAGELAVLYCFVFLYLAAAGAGPWSVDRILRGERA
jgi:putative oxidoreductase